jgi:hypothetical protein
MEIKGLQASEPVGKDGNVEMTFDQVQAAFDELKKRLQKGEISRQSFIEEIKKLRLKDDQGRFWTIGLQTGKWYYFDGKDWLQADPPNQKEKMICVFCGFENKLEAEVCARCGGIKGEEPSVCLTCGGPLQKPFQTCPRCKPEPEEFLAPGSIHLEEAVEEKTLILRGLRPLSALISFGLLGVFFGVLLGAFAGATGAFSDSLGFLPAGLAEQQGKLMGAIFLGLLGGAAGFLFFGAVAVILAVVFNFILNMTGGLKLDIGQKPFDARPEPNPEKNDKVDSQDTGFGFNLKD